MGINTGFGSHGFVDDRKEQDRWDRLDKKLSGKSLSASGETEIDDSYELDDNDTAKSSTEIKNMQSAEYKVKRKSKGGFWNRNKRQILDAALVLGVIYVGYKLFWDKDGGGDLDFEDGGITSTPTPAPAPEPYKFATPIPQAAPQPTPEIPNVPPMSPVSTP